MLPGAGIAALSIKVFTVNLGTTSNRSYMQDIAAAGNGEWVYSATGTDLDSVFQGIGQPQTCDDRAPGSGMIAFGGLNTGRSTEDP